MKITPHARRTVLGMVTGLAVLGSAACAASSVSTTGSVNSGTTVTTVASMGLSVPPAVGGSSKPVPSSGTGSPASSGAAASAGAAKPLALKPVTEATKVLKSDKGGVVMLAPVVLNGKTFLFIVDTGATASTIDAGVAKSLGLATKGPAIVGKGLACKNTAQPVSVTSWSVGGETLPPETMVATDIGFTGKKLDGTVVGGLLGSDVYSVFGSVSLDYKNASLALGGVAPAGQQSFPIQVKSQNGAAEAIASTTIHGVPANLIVDTGSSRTEVDSQLAAKAHLQKAGATVKLGTVGCTTTAQPVAINDLTVGSVSMPKLVAVSSDNSGAASASGRVNQGLLGSDVLSTFGKVTVDFENKKVTLGG